MERITVEDIKLMGDGFNAKLVCGDKWVKATFVRKAPVKTFVANCTTNFPINTYPLKDAYSTLTKEMGVTPSTMEKIAWASFYDQIIAPNKDLMSRYAFRRGGYSFKTIDRVLNGKGILEQAIKDGQWNIMPILVATGKSPQELKKIFGKGLWKSLCKNSHYRNKMIADCGGFSRTYGKTAGYGLVEEFQKFKTCRFPQVSAIRELSSYYTDEVRREMFKHVFKYPSTHIERLGGKTTYTFLRDTIFMGLDLGEDIPKDVFSSRERLFEVHNEYAQRRRTIQAEFYKKSNEFNLSGSKYPKEFKAGEAIAKLIQTHEELEQEGKKQHHCVGSYASFVKSGNYLVYHLHDGKESATLGIRIQEEGNQKFVEDQIYAACNQPVKSDTIKACAEELIKKLNKEC